MSKSLVDEFQSLISPFSDQEVQRAIKTLYVVYNDRMDLELKDCPNHLYNLINEALIARVYESLAEVNLMQIILDKLKDEDFIESVALELDKVCNVGYLGYKMDYIDEGQTEQFLFYLIRIGMRRLQRIIKKDLANYQLGHIFSLKMPNWLIITHILKDSK
ncbi:hypothetical protein [Campylobacter sp. MIT 97-5078]|uniref:hypothetical protein n=1 Tax=Campylobacter sp. MIT 97-5078 TaxID=1548153 RepID=UPI0005145EB7|nr:hypothetical protein [Campylobacter sp. MIT 97-5078]KGI55452.1 hypothetical protein LR59_12055 [Campylobacter sp. MIT 97-5078]KGI57361.1 hypothetical protein LR59_01125 [Campylobacter sp. MIT 97-5078]TQR27449.1 hypothetical protein DMB91_04115 [Campylobacter sp. MIT 97-5078]